MLVENLESFQEENHRHWQSGWKYIYRNQFCLCTCRLERFSLFFSIKILQHWFWGISPTLFSFSVSFLSSSTCHSCLSSKEAVLFSFHRLPTEQAWRRHPSSHQGSHYLISSTMSFVNARVYVYLRVESCFMWNPNTMHHRLTTDPAVWPTQGINVRATETPDNSLVSNAHSWQRGIRSQHSMVVKRYAAKW